MEPILQINQVSSNDENTLSYRITITQGAENVNTEDILRLQLKETYPYKKGIIEVTRLSNNVWEVITNK